MKALLVRAAAVASVSLAIDQLTKVFARASLALCTTHGAVGCERIDLVAGSELIRVRNAGSALGFAHDLWIWVPIALAGLTLVLVYARAGGARAPSASAKRYSSEEIGPPATAISRMARGASPLARTSAQ